MYYMYNMYMLYMLYMYYVCHMSHGHGHVAAKGTANGPYFVRAHCEVERVCDHFS